MAHDFKNFPELTNNQMLVYYFDSPHKQITEDILAIVTKVIDGDTIRVKWRERNFDFPVRFRELAAPELNERGGREAQSWLEERIIGEEVLLKIDKSNRVDKWGRLLAEVFHEGLSITEEEVWRGLAVHWSQRGEGKI